MFRKSVRSTPHEDEIAARLVDDDEDSEFRNTYLEHIPSDINIPKTSHARRKSVGKSFLSKRGSVRRKDSVSTRASVRARRTDEEYIDLLENHEVVIGQDGTKTITMLDIDDSNDEDEVEGETSTGRSRLVRMPRHWTKNLNLFEGVGGGAMSFAVLLILIMPPIAMLAAGVPYFTVQFFFIPCGVYIYMSFPAFIGWMFAFGLRYLGPLNGFPFECGAITITPWLKDYRIHVRLLAQDCSFGNPPGFPFKDFLTVRRVDMEGSFPLRHLANLLLLRKEKVPLSKVPDFERFIKFDFDHIDVDGAMCNFQMYENKFNISEFTRILADGEARAVLGKKKPFPNQLSVRIVRAKHLLPHRLKRTCDPYVVVRCRRQEQKTHTQNMTVQPMWDETMHFNVDDASIVMEISVYDRDSPEGNQAALIGHWAMTIKYLVTDPSFCWHYNKGFETYTVRRPASDGSTGFSGWVPLATKKWKRMGLCGQLEIELTWNHVPEAELINPYTPPRNYTALEQLTQQSYEDQLRFGDWARVRDWLSHEPFCYDVRRFTIRDTRFYVQDLFRGHKGKPEMLIQNNQGVEGADFVKLPFLEMRKQFRPKNGDEGVTTYDVFVGFFVGLLTSAARSGRLGSAIAQIFSGGMFNFGTTFRMMLQGQLDRALPINSRNIKSMASKVRTGVAVMHQNVTVARRNKAQFKFPIQASDEDFLSTEIELSGHLDRCAVKMKSEISNSGMAQLAKRRGNFKTKYHELKGETLFFRRHRETPKDAVYNLTYKVDLGYIYSAVYVEKYDELLLNVHDDTHVVRLRDGKTLPPNPPPKDQPTSNVVREWVQVIKAHGIPLEEFLEP